MVFSKYQVINILENCFQNMNCFSWTKLIPILIHLKYWYYNSTHLELHCLFHHLFEILPLPTETPLQYITYHFPITFPILSYPIPPHATTSIGYIKPYAKPSQSNVLSSYIHIIISYGSKKLLIKKLIL